MARFNLRSVSYAGNCIWANHYQISKKIKFERFFVGAHRYFLPSGNSILFDSAGVAHGNSRPILALWTRQIELPDV